MSSTKKSSNEYQNQNKSKTLFPAVFLDENGCKLSKGDKVIVTLKGLGSGEMEIVEHENELCLYDVTQGYYQVKHAIYRDDIIIELIS